MGEQEIDKTCYLGMLAHGYAQLGLNAQALEAIEQALELARKTGENYFTAELLRLKAELLLRSGDGQAQSLLRRSLALARRQAARTWERRAGQSLAAVKAKPPGQGKST
jgi:tetratricopeptide (TPR) repeat protein